MIDKKLVKDRFEKAFDKYQKNATIQKEIADELFFMWQSFTPKAKNILEIGTGTGNLTRNIISLQAIERLYLNDLTSSIKTIEKEIPKNIKTEFLIGDIENITLPNNLDAVLSCSTIQWLDDVESFIKKLAQNINQGGFIAFSSFANGHYQEIKELTNQGLDYLEKEKWQEILKPDFDILILETKDKIMEFSSPFEALKHIKNTGVSGINKSIWTKQKLKGFEEKYIEKFSLSNGNISLSYKPIYIIGVKK